MASGGGWLGGYGGSDGSRAEIASHAAGAGLQESPGGWGRQREPGRVY